MSSLTAADRHALENFLGMSGGYVLSFNDRSFAEFVFEAVGVDIHDDQFTIEGTSKAKKLRAFWKTQPDHLTGKLVLALVGYKTELPTDPTAEEIKLVDKCRHIGTRLLAGTPRLDPLKAQAKILNAGHLAEQIRRLEDCVEFDPSLAIGTAKELIETCCKTILAERGKGISGTPDVSTLTKETLKELKLVPEGIPETARGAEGIKRIWSSLGAVGNGLTELRGLNGTGHGKHGSESGLSSRHAKLAVGDAATLTVFLFETHHETEP